MHVLLLTAMHKEDRVPWAGRHVAWSVTEREKVVFTDKKKLNLDGPDGSVCHWHNFRTEEKLFSTRKNVRGGIMICGDIFISGKTRIAVLKGSQDATKFMRTLCNYFRLLAADNNG